jgi:hypothetical protein
LGNVFQEKNIVLKKIKIMKKLVNLFPIALAIFFFSSCNKCKDCSCSQTITQDGQTYTQSVEYTDVCDEDLDNIQGTISFTQNVGGIEQSVEQTCTCK